jgi:N-acetylmuramoyl-L-alanine amidase
LTIKIALDAGHGGKDSGAVGNGLQEKNLTLDIILRINDILKNYEDVETVLTRSSDIFVELSERANISNRNNCDCFLSVHINSGGTVTSARGYQDHIYTNVDAATHAYQNVMHDEVFNGAYRGFTNDRGKEQSNFAVVRETNCIAILTENLFITNPTEAGFLSDPNNRQKIAQAHVNGFVKYFGLKRKTEAQPPPASNPTGKLYKVQVGAFGDKKNAQAMENDLLRNGYKPVIQYDAGDKFYHVQVGAFENKDNATKLLAALQKDGYRAVIKYE